MSRQFKFALAIALTSAMTEAGTLRKIWDFDAGAPGVYRLSFSPDGQRIVAVVGPAWDKQFVLVLDAADPNVNRRRLETDPRDYGNNPVSWSPSGQQLMLGSTRVRLGDGNTCSLEEAKSGIFIGEDRLIRQEIRHLPSSRPRTPPQGQPFLKFFNSDCREGEEWNLPDEQTLFDSSAERGLICVRQGARTLIIDALSRTVLQDVSSLGRQAHSFFRTVFFADSGKAICGVVGPDWGVTVSCLDVDTGKELATTRKFTYLGISTALHARRVVLSDYGRYLYLLVDPGWYLGSLKKRIVWDLGTNKEMVSWSPKSQTLVTLDRPAGSRQPYAYDISPDGECIVEGGAGTVSLYRIEP